jgi:RimJ/RimL family protein N-acetyltransferase
MAPVMVYLETSRLLLRHLTAEDEDNLIELDGDPEVMRYLTGELPTSREKIRDQVLPRLLRYYSQSDRFGYWAAVDKATGEFLGWFCFRPRLGGSEGDESDRQGIELGYRLRRAAWGKGYATEGSRALIHKGFTELGVERVFAETRTANQASRRVMEKAGLMYVRTIHQDRPNATPGSEHGEVEYALTRAEWQSRQTR